MPEISATQLAFGLFFICLPIAMYRFFKLGFISGAETMVAQLHQSNYLTSKCVKDLGIMTPEEEQN